MTYRKTWFSYVLWAVYAGLCIMLLTFVGFNLFAGYISSSMARIGGLLIFPIAVGAYWGIRIISQMIRKKYVMHTHTANMLEFFVVAFSVVFGTLFRISSVLYSEMYFDSVLAMPAPICDIAKVPYTSYYDMALVRAGDTLEQLTHGAGYLYVICISTVCSFLGNRIASAVMLQAVIQMISIVLAYVVVRKVVGKLAACVVLVYLSFSDTYLGEMYNLSPECFVFMLYMLGLLLITAYLKDYCDNRFSKPVAVCGAVLVGLVTGILAYLDLKLIILLVFLIALFTGRKITVLEKEYANNGTGMSVAAFMVAIVSCAAGLCVMSGIVSLYRGTDFMQDISVWASLYQQKFQIEVIHNFEQIRPELPVIALLMIAASFLVFEYFRCGKEQNFMLWILACLLITPTPMFVAGIMPYQMIALFQWSVLAGVGLQNCIFGDKAEVVRAKIEEINAEAAQVGAMQSVKDAGVPDREKQVQEEEKPRFIENPLPLPKKHVKKEMDYQYPVEDKDMKYDIEVDEKDDFDIQ